MSFKKISLIGAGVMGESLIAALLKAGHLPEHIEIFEKREERLKELVSKYGIKVGSQLKGADALLLVVKPQDLQSLLTEISGQITESTLIVSFVAGKKIEFIKKSIGKNNSVIRVMPNTPALVGKGAAGYSLSSDVDQHQSRFVNDLLNAAGKAVQVPEDLIDAVTATSGSGPAYFFAFVEAMIEGAIKLGLPEDVATELTVQTLIGSAALLESSGKSAKTLRENVTSPNGTTFAALQSFASSDLESIVANAMKAARDRSIELS